MTPHSPRKECLANYKHVNLSELIVAPLTVVSDLHSRLIAIVHGAYRISQRRLWPKLHQQKMLGKRQFRHPCGRKRHEADHASLTSMRSSVQTLNARGAAKHLASLSRARLGCPPGEELWDGFSVEPSSVMGTLHAITLAEGPRLTNLHPPEDTFVRLLFRDYSHGRYETSSQSAFGHLVHLKSARRSACLSSWHGEPRALCVRTDAGIARSSCLLAAWAKVLGVQV